MLVTNILDGVESILFLLSLTTNNGFVGYGEVYSASISPEKMTYVIEDIFERHMKGENPENIELMFRRFTLVDLLKDQTQQLLVHFQV